MKKFINKAFGITAIAVALGLIAPKIANAETVDNVINNTTPVNISDSLQAHGAEVRFSYFQAGTMLDYIATNATPGVIVIDNLNTGQMNEPNAVVIDSTISPTLKSNLIQNQGIEYTVVDISADANTTEAWATIDNALFGNPSVSAYDYHLLVAARPGSNITVFDPVHMSTPLDYFEDGDNNGTEWSDTISRSTDVADFFFQIRNPSGQFENVDTLVSNVVKGQSYFNFIQDPLAIADSVHNLSFYTTPGASIDIAGIGTLTADLMGQADTSLVDTANVNIDLSITLNEHYQRDSTMTTLPGSNNVIVMPLNSWPQYIAQGNTNATLIDLVNATTSDTIASISQANGNINAGSYLYIFKDENNQLIANVEGSNPSLINTVTDTWVLNEGINVNDLFIDTTGAPVFHYNLVGYATLSANYVMSNFADTTEILQMFTASNVPALDTNTTTYSITFDHANSSLDLRVQGNRNGFQNMDSTFVVNDGLEDHDIRLKLNDVGIEEVNKEKGTYDVFPNPFDNKINVSYSNNDLDKSRTSMTDIVGRNQNIEYNMDPFNNTMTIDTENISSGVYIITTTAESGVQHTEKVVKK